MRVTVLGSSASYAGAGQACAGYLVLTDIAHVLFDCGNGVLANLARVTDPLSLDAVFLTHEHVDHLADIYALQALLRYAPSGPVAPLPLFAPPGLFERMGALLNPRGRVELEEAFEVADLVHGEAVTIGDLSVQPVLVDHVSPTFALRAESSAGVMCYTSDTAAGDRAREAAQGCDLLLAEATLPNAYAGRAPHMTAREAGALAREAGVGRLVLTHIWPTNDRDSMKREAAEEYEGPVDVAAEFETYDVRSLDAPARGVWR